MILHCQKTGRHWPCASTAQGDEIARGLGLKDYVITVAGDPPPPVRAVIAEMRARPRCPITTGLE